MVAVTGTIRGPHLTRMLGNWHPLPGHRRGPEYAALAGSVRGLLAEALVLACCGGAVGLALGYWTVKAIPAVLSTSLAGVSDVAIDWRVVAFTSALSLGSAILFMLWLQITMLALLLGAEVNQVLLVRARRRRSAGDAVDAGSVGEDDPGKVPPPPVAAEATTAGGSTRETTGGSLRAATTPVPSLRTTSGRSTQHPTTGADRGTGRSRTATAADGRAVAVAVRGHAGDGAAPAGATGHPAHNSAGAPDRDVRTVTLIGAGVAAVSGLVGLAGLLRRLRT